MDNNNNVELAGFYGSDETHALSAWTSTSRELTDEKRNRIPKLLADLAKNEHHTPFEKSSLHFLVTTDISSHIHIIKHRVATSVNAECLTGDAVITFTNINSSSSKKNKISVKDLFNKWTNGRVHQNTKKDMLYSQNRIKKMRIRVLNESTGLFETSHIKDIWYKGINHVYKITLENGKTLKCTDNHRIYTKNGYKTIKTGLSTLDFVGCNGVIADDKKRPWTYKDFFENAEQYTRHEFSVFKGISYELCKKWGYIHDIIFKIDDKKDFKKGGSPWNKGLKGYKLNITEKGLMAKRKNVENNHKGEKSNFWRGGITKERDLIGVWTTNQAKYVHKKYNYVCQFCGKKKKDLVAHHIIPVCADISQAYNFNNLITVCRDCHKKIHKNSISEKEFACSVLNRENFLIDIGWVKRKRSNKLKVDFSKVSSIIYLGKEDTYDIEIEGDNNNYVANGIVVHNSARYKELKEDKTYLPDDWTSVLVSLDSLNKIPEELKADSWKGVLEKYTNLGNLLYHLSIKDVEKPLGRKRAKESCRFFKTYNSQITADVMFNFRSFMHFQKLRNSEHAQKEIREIAQKMLKLVQETQVFKYSLEAFGYDS